MEYIYPLFSKSTRQFQLKKTILYLCLIVINHWLFGQPDQDYNTVEIPVAPTSASLGEYGFAPVNLSRGMINISIPIHEIKGEDLSLPISLNYRPGVKVAEVSEYTGHGWS